MKKALLAISAALILILGLSGCEQGGNEPQKPQKEPVKYTFSYQRYKEYLEDYEDVILLEYDFNKKAVGTQYIPQAKKGYVKEYTAANDSVTFVDVAVKRVYTNGDTIYGIVVEQFNISENPVIRITDDTEYYFE